MQRKGEGLGREKRPDVDGERAVGDAVVKIGGNKGTVVITVHPAGLRDMPPPPCTPLEPPSPAGGVVESGGESLKNRDIWRRIVEFLGPRSCCTA